MRCTCDWYICVCIDYKYVCLLLQIYIWYNISSARLSYMSSLTTINILSASAHKLKAQPENYQKRNEENIKQTIKNFEEQENLCTHTFSSCVQSCQLQHVCRTLGKLFARRRYLTANRPRPAVFFRSENLFLLFFFLEANNSWIFVGRLIF